MLPACHTHNHSYGFRSSCEHCNELQLMIERLERELTHRQQELQGKDELNQFLKGQIR